MSQLIDVPGHGQVEFPDGMSEADIVAAIKKNSMAYKIANDPISKGARNFAKDMPAWQQFAAAYGGAAPSLWNGVRQLFDSNKPTMSGLVTGDKRSALQQEIDEQKKLMAPLNATGAGMAGNIAGNAALLAPAAFVPGANTILGGAALGAGSGLLTPTATGESTAANIGLGALGGSAGVLLGRAVPAVARSLAAPFTRNGQENIVGRTLQQFAPNGIPNVRAGNTPGYRPTLAEASQVPGLAILERGAAASNPQTAGALAERGLENNAAALNTLRGIGGTDPQMNMAQGLRSYMTEGLYNRASQQGVDPAMSAAMQPQIDNLMARPAMQRAITEASGIMNERSVEMARGGSVEGLQLVKQALDDAIERASATGTKMGANQLRALNTTRGDLISVLEQIAPALREADTNYRTFSRPINEMNVGRELTDRLTPALMDFSPGVPSKLKADQYAQVVRGLEDRLPALSGYQGATLENTMSGPALDSINGIARDLAGRAKAGELGRGVGSNTAQNLASRNVMRQALGPLGLPDSWAESMLAEALGTRPLGFAFRPAENNVQEILAQALLNPQMANQLMSRMPPPPGLLTRAYQGLLAPVGAGSQR